MGCAASGSRFRTNRPRLCSTSQCRFASGQRADSIYPEPPSTRRSCFFVAFGLEAGTDGTVYVVPTEFVNRTPQSTLGNKTLVGNAPCEGAASNLESA